MIKIRLCLEQNFLFCFWETSVIYTAFPSLSQGNNVDLILTIQKLSVMPLQTAKMELHLFLIQEASFLNVDVIQAC